MKIFVTGDTHFGHDKLCEIGGRPKDFSMLEIANLAKTQGDIIIHVGDFCIGNDRDWARMYMIATKNFARRIFVRGNHDSRSDSFYYNQGFDFVCNSFVITHFKQRFLFTHEPFWDSLNGKINVHGHLHGNAHRHNEFPIGYDHKQYYDVAPELHEYKPVSLEHIFHATKKPVSPDR